MTAPLCDEIVAIDDADELYRRITSFQLNPDDTVNSAAFKLRGKPDPSLSVELAKRTTVTECRDRPNRPALGVAILVAAAPRTLGLAVDHDPCPPEEPTNVAHALIIGASTKQQLRAMVAAATALLVPPGRVS